MTRAVPGQAWIPDACTLPTIHRPLRLAEFDDLFATALCGVDRVGPLVLRLSFAGHPALQARVRDLAAKESECCAFFSFTISSAGVGRIDCDIEVPAAQVAVLDAIAALAARTARTAHAARATAAPSTRPA